jgi:anti-sigma-K factor RskA
MNGHPQFDEDFDLLVLGMLEEGERRELEAHLASCQQCARRAEEARGRMAALAFSAPFENPPARARERLLRRVRPPVARTQSFSLRPWLALPLGAVAVVLIVVVGLQNRNLRYKLKEVQQAEQVLRSMAAQDHAVVDLLTAPDTLRITLVSEASHSIPVGKAFYHPEKGLIFYAANLPALSPRQTYQLWLVPTGGNPISAGTFEVDLHGNGQVTLPKLPVGVQAAAFAVTVEPSGGVPQPTGPKILIGAVS